MKVLLADDKVDSSKVARALRALGRALVEAEKEASDDGEGV